jgi:hypothetical protein
MTRHERSIWVFHRGALGDSVLLWPFLRRLSGRGYTVTFIADWSKADLARHEIGVTPLSAELPIFTALWSAEGGGGASTDGPPLRPLPASGPGALPRLVFTFLANPRTAAGQCWLRNARALFPAARILSIANRPDRALALRLAGCHGLIQPARLQSPSGPTILHVGAGSPAKRWPMEQWATLHAQLGAPDAVRVIAGEVEQERFTPDERRLFDSIRGCYLSDLRALAHTLRSARLVIAADSGPAHLAAQFGVRTLTLFGPTDPFEWAPIGPQVRILAPAKPRAMGWLAPETVAAAALEIFSFGA